MMKNKISFLFLFSIVVFSCKKEACSKENNIISKQQISDIEFLENEEFNVGDVRRYGLFPNKSVSPNRLQNIIELAKKGFVITFPEGIYKTNLVIKGCRDLCFVFNNASLSGSLQILEDDDNKESKNIFMKGSLTVLDKVFIRKSKNIEFDTLTVKTDTLNNLYNKFNRGVSIYAGAKYISFKKMIIIDTGGMSDQHFTHTAAALQVHGWNNNPENIYIDFLRIENAARTGVYITGNKHIINKAIIKNYAQNGDVNNLFGLEDASPGSEREFSGFWINKCNDCYIDSLEINNNSTKPYSLRFGIGKYSKPAIINYLSLKHLAKGAPIKDNTLTNVLIKHEY